MSGLSNSYDLYFDESGLFIETSKNPAERVLAHREGKKFPSQLAGLLAPRDSLTEKAAQMVLKRFRKAAGLDPRDDFHAMNVQEGEMFDGCVTTCVKEVLAHGWQPVRLVNLEQVSFGDRVANYTNLVAEMLLRIFQTKRAEGESRVSIRIIAAIVRLEEHENGVIDFLEDHDYLTRIDEILTREALRRGEARGVSDWKVDHFRTASGKKDPRLQLCDLISNASRDDYVRCGQEAKATLRKALGDYDRSLKLRELIDRVDERINEGSLAMAIVLLAERLNSRDQGGQIQSECLTRLANAIAGLAQLPTDPRDSQLSLLISWLGQTIELRQRLEESFELKHWLSQKVFNPLVDHLSSKGPSNEVDWFGASLHRLGLTACNHLGNVEDARKEIDSFNGYVKSLAGHWEHAPLLMEAFVHEAVHLNDCFEYQGASEKMELVSKYYSTLSSLFGDAFPNLFPERVRSQLRGKALGTRMQSEMGLGLSEPSHFELARRLNEEALDEFESKSDKLRQYQYRCELETGDGQLSAARKNLARSLELDDDSHSHRAIAETLAELKWEQQGFGLLHWLRLGATSCLLGQEAESRDFLAASRAAGLLGTRWCQGEIEEYPAHGILRRVAIVHAHQGERDEALSSLVKLQTLRRKEPRQIVFDTILVAAQTEVAGLIWSKHQKHAQQLLNNFDDTRPGLIQLLDALKNRSETRFPAVWRHFETWPGLVNQVLSHKETPDVLIRLGRTISY